MFPLFVSLVVQMQGNNSALIEKVVIPHGMKNGWVVVEFSPQGKKLKKEVVYEVPDSGYLKTSYRAPSTPTKVLFKVGDGVFMEAANSPMIHHLGGVSMGSASLTGKKALRKFLVFYFGDEKMIDSSWRSHVPE